MELRPFQAPIKDQLRAGIRAGDRRQLLVLPTGAGKTIVSADLIASSVSAGRRSLFLAPRRQLVDQAWRKLTDPALVGLDPERTSVVMGQDKRWRSGAPVTVSCAASLAGRDLSADPQLVIVDEAHLDMPLWRPIVDRWPHAAVIGLTATPGPGLADVFTTLHAPIGTRELTELGHLARATCYSVPEESEPDIRDVALDGDDFQTRPLAAAMQRPNVTGDVVSHWRRLSGGRPTLAFCVTKAHAEQTTQLFNDAAVSAAFLHSGMSSREREAVLARFRARELVVLTSCDCLSEGFDEPPAKCAILLRPTESLEKHLQICGRVLRVFGDETAVIIDHVGNIRKHGLPTFPHEWTLEGAKPQPREALAVQQCPECWCLHEPAPACPMCGCVRAPKPGRRLRILRGELVEVTEDKTVRRAPTREQALVTIHKQLALPWARKLTEAGRESFKQRRLRELLGEEAA